MTSIIKQLWEDLWWKPESPYIKLLRWHIKKAAKIVLVISVIVSIFAYLGFVGKNPELKESRVVHYQIISPEHRFMKLNADLYAKLMAQISLPEEVREQWQYFIENDHCRSKNSKVLQIQESEFDSSANTDFRCFETQTLSVYLYNDYMQISIVYFFHMRDLELTWKISLLKTPRPVQISFKFSRIGDERFLRYVEFAWLDLDTDKRKNININPTMLKIYSRPIDTEYQLISCSMEDDLFYFSRDNYNPVPQVNLRPGHWNKERNECLLVQQDSFPRSINRAFSRYKEVKHPLERRIECSE